MDRSVSSQWTRSVVGVHGPGVSLFGSPYIKQHQKGDHIRGGGGYLLEARGDIKSFRLL